MNQNLWKNRTYYEVFLKQVTKFENAMLENPYNPYICRDIANNLDDLRQLYEIKYGDIKDPLFYYYFASANAMFLNKVKARDSLTDIRKKWIINGFKEGLRRHEMIGCYTKEFIKVAIYCIEKFSNGAESYWIEQNKYKWKGVNE